MQKNHSYFYMDLVKGNWMQSAPVTSLLVWHLEFMEIFFKLPHHVFNTEELKHIISFIKNFAEDHGILLPGKIPGYKRMDLQLLPTNMSKKLVWTQYTKANEQSNRRLAAYTTFCSLWKKYVPQTIITKPQSECQGYNRRK